MIKSILIIMQIAAIFLLFFESGYIFLNWKTRIQRFLFLICVSTLINSLGYFVAIQASTLEAYLAGLQMSYVGRVWVPFSLLLFVNALCGKKNYRKVMVGLSFVHLFVLFLVMTCKYHSLYYMNVYLDLSGIFPCIHKDRGIFYSLYNLLIFVYMFYGIYLLIRAIIEEKNPIQKKRVLMVFAAVLAESIFYIIELGGRTVGFDDTVLGYAIGSVFMFIAIFRYSLIDTLQIASDYVIDEVSEGIVVINQNDEIEYFNLPAKKIFPKLEFYSPQILKSIRKSISSGEPLRIEDKIFTPEERELTKDGTVIGTIYVLIDDTEHYKYMDELKEQKEVAEAANASKSAFLSIVSHEIRTPMNAVVGMTELLLKEGDQLSDKQEKYLRNIKNSGSSLVMIVNDILDQSKIEAGKMEIIEDSYELRPMTEDVKMIIENRIGSKPISLLLEIDERIPDYIVGDSLRIRQILINLMNNAVKFTEEGYIKLSISCEKELKDKLLLKFAVQDSGQGIKEEDLSKLGQAFSQVDTKKNHNKEGTGLGLSISRDFINMMGGQLEVKSEYSKGSEFFFSICQGLCVSDEKADSEIPRPQAWKEDIEFTTKDARILVVDDNEINLMIMDEYMSMLELETDTASSGEEAIELAKEKRYDLIFMDYMMPHMDGVETTKRIRELSESDSVNADLFEAGYYERLPIITLSGDSSLETRGKFKAAGINDFTEKPVDIKKLKAMIIKWFPEDKICYRRN